MLPPPPLAPSPLESRSLAFFLPRIPPANILAGPSLLLGIKTALFKNLLIFIRDVIDM